jgi:hypothetical protein
MLTAPDVQTVLVLALERWVGAARIRTLSPDDVRNLAPYELPAAEALRRARNLWEYVRDLPADDPCFVALATSGMAAAELLAVLEAGLPAKNAPAFLQRLTAAVCAVTVS